MRQEFLVVHADWTPDGPLAPGLGSAAMVKKALEDQFGPTEWELGQGLFDGDGFSFLAKLGILQEVASVTFETWGKGNPAPIHALWCGEHGWKAINLDTGEDVRI